MGHQVLTDSVHTCSSGDEDVIRVGYKEVRENRKVHDIPLYPSSVRFVWNPLSASSARKAR